MAARAERSRMGDLLLEMGLLDEPTLQAAIVEQRVSGRRLPRILGEKRVLDEERLTKAVATKLGLEVVNVSSLKIHERVLALIPAAIAIKYGVLPIAIKRASGAEYLYLVMADPLDAEAIGEVQRVTGRQVRVLMASASDLDQAIDSQYRAIHGKHVTPMPPAQQSAPPPQPPPQQTSSAPAKPASAQPAARKSEPPAPLPVQRASAVSTAQKARPTSVPRPADPATGGPTELVRAAQPRPNQPTPVPVGHSRAGAQIASGTHTLRRPSKAEPQPQPPPMRVSTQDLIQPMPLDAPGEEPKTRIDDPGQEDWELAVRDWSPPGSARSGGLSQPAGAHQVRVDEPVTTEAQLIEVDLDHDEPFELIEIEAEEIHTGQIELEELSAAQVIAMQPQPVHNLPPSSIELVRAFEIPIEVEEPHHPFEGPSFEEIHTGLERTGIIPAIDFDSDRFEPPPLPESVKPNRALIGGDIPTSKAAVEARQALPPASNHRSNDTQEGPKLDFAAALDLPPAEPPKKRKSDPPEKVERGPSRGELTQSDDSDADAMPVIEPSSLMSLMDFETTGEDTSRQQQQRKREEQRVEVQTLAPEEPSSAGEEVEDDAVLSALDGQFAEALPMEDAVQLTPVTAVEVDERARGLVASLVAGQSLKSAERAELLLALGRLLIRKGVINEEELALELTLDAGD